MTPALRAALWYARKGLAVFPCRRDKRPLVPHGVKDATTDEKRVRAWWAKWPDASIGIATGDVFALDLDRKGGVDGVSTFARVQEGFGDVPETWRQRTGSGGEQLFFRVPPGVVIRNSAGKLFGDRSGVDVRGRGGYAIVAPSRNEAGEYQWLASPRETELAPAPDWLLEAIAAAQGNGAPAEPIDSASDDISIPEGRRNAALTALGGALRRIGLSREAIAAALLVANRERCRPALEAPEVERIAASVARYPTADDAARADEAAPVFEVVQDLEALPETFDPPEYAIEGLLFRGAFTLLGGDPKAGKSTLAVEAALAVAGGSRVFGELAPRVRGPVVVIQADEPRRLFLWKLRQLARGRGLTRLDFPFGFLCTDRLNLADARQREKLLEEILKRKPELVVVDPLRDVYLGPENDSETLKPVLDFFVRARNETGAAVLVVDHLGKPAGRAGGPRGYMLRGSGAKFGRCDSALIVTRSGDVSELSATHRWAAEGERRRFRLEVEDSGMFAGWRLELLDFDSSGRPPEATRPERDQAARAEVLRALDAHEWRSTRAVRDATGRRTETVQRALEDLETAGEVESQRQHRGVAWRLRIPENRR